MFLGRLANIFLRVFHQLLLQTRVTSTDMLCALQIKSNDEYQSLAILKTYFNYHNTYGHQTWQMVIHSATTDKFIWTFDNIVLQSHMTN